MSQKQLSIKQNMLWNSFGSLANLGCQWLITVLIVRLAGGFEDAGTYSLAVSIYAIFYPIGHYRMRTYQVSDVNRENSAAEYMGLRLLTSALSHVLCMGYAALTCSSEALPAIFFYSLYRIATLIVDVLHGCDQQEHRMDYIGKSLALQGVGTLIAFVSTYALFSSLELSLIAMLITVTLVGLFFDYPRTRRFDNPLPRIGKDKALKLLITCFPIVLASIAAAAMPTIPRQLISTLMGQEQLGIYASVAAPVAIIQMGASYIYSPLLSYYSESYAHKNRREFYHLFKLTALAVATIGIVCGIALNLAGEELLALVFGNQIRGYTYLMTPMIVLAIFTGYMWFMGELMTALRNFRSVWIGNGLSLAIVLVSVVPAIESFGLNGATYSTIAATIGAIFVMYAALAIQLRDYWKTQ